MLDCKLNKNQINFFHTFGFILFKGLFLDKIDDINNSFEEVCKLKTKKQKINFTKIERLCIPQFIDLHNNLTNLLDDERIINIGESIFPILVGIRMDGKVIFYILNLHFI